MKFRNQPCAIEEDVEITCARDIERATFQCVSGWLQSFGNQPRRAFSPVFCLICFASSKAIGEARSRVPCAEALSDQLLEFNLE